MLEWMGLIFYYYDGLQPKMRAGIINEHECIYRGKQRRKRDSIEQKLRETSHVIIKRKLGWSSVQWDFICNNSQASLVGILATLNCQVGYGVSISRVKITLILSLFKKIIFKGYVFICELRDSVRFLKFSKFEYHINLCRLKFCFYIMKTSN